VTISYQDFIKESAARKPETQSLTAAPLTGANFYVSPTAPTAASDNSLWFNTQQQESKLYVKYVNNWIGVQ
jgi:hypothetical protein